MVAFGTLLLGNSPSRRRNRRIFADFLALVVAIFLLGLVGSLTPRKWGDDSHSICEGQICVANSGFHTELLVPEQNQIFDWQNYLEEFDISTGAPARYRYLGFGWGERAFFMDPPKKIEPILSLGFKALFLPTPSVVRVQGHFSIPLQKEVKCVGVSRSGYLKLVEFIQDSFQLDNQGRKILIGVGRQPQTSFYAAKGSYSLLRTSNSWTAEGLRSANVNTPLWAGLSSPIMFHLSRSCELDQVWERAFMSDTTPGESRTPSWQNLPPDRGIGRPCRP